MNENQPTFAPEARAELLAMYTGMAMQGILMVDVLDRPESVAKAAVAQANATIDALEAYHVSVARQAEVVPDMTRPDAAVDYLNQVTGASDA